MYHMYSIHVLYTIREDFPGNQQQRRWRTGFDDDGDDEDDEIEMRTNGANKN